jgi:hypothetical protein
MVIVATSDMVWLILVAMIIHSGGFLVNGLVLIVSLRIVVGLRQFRLIEFASTNSVNPPHSLSYWIRNNSAALNGETIPVLQRCFSNTKPAINA